MEELISSFEAEITEYGKLVELSKKKTPIIVKGDIEALEKLTDEESDLTSKIKNIDNFRLSKTTEIANVLNKKKEDMTLTNLIELMDTRPEEKKQLADIKTRITSVLAELKTVNEQNAVLINQALEMVEFDLTLFRSLRQAPETANYDKRAYNTGTLLGGGGFDASQ